MLQFQSHLTSGLPTAVITSYKVTTYIMQVFFVFLINENNQFCQDYMLFQLKREMRMQILVWNFFFFCFAVVILMSFLSRGAVKDSYRPKSPQCFTSTYSRQCEVHIKQTQTHCFSAVPSPRTTTLKMLAPTRAMLAPTIEQHA